MSAARPPAVPSPRLASGWFLGCIVVALAVLLWLRGLGRILLPMLFFAGLGYAAWRFVQKVKEPLP
ncbi:MAG: hypothetical protein IT281_09850 [Ignavibacteria bacterium]|nr:hypothetical protein [Ignavibacteria bacterium]